MSNSKQFVCICSRPASRITSSSRTRSAIGAIDSRTHLKRFKAIDTFPQMEETSLSRKHLYEIVLYFPGGNILIPNCLQC